VLVETAQSVTAGSMKQLLKDVVCHGLSSAGFIPAVRKLFAGRAGMITFHEVQTEFRYELATGTSSPYFEHSLS
jgi:hypothetical protein